jgi:flavin-dependent dehydrogenase
MTDRKPENQPHVVIVGGGFGGLNAIKALKRAPVRVTLIDRSNHHLFQPLLYQVATAGLSPAEIATPIRSAVRKQQNASTHRERPTRDCSAFSHPPPGRDAVERRDTHPGLLCCTVQR